MLNVLAVGMLNRKNPCWNYNTKHEESLYTNITIRMVQGRQEQQQQQRCKQGRRVAVAITLSKYITLLHKHDNHSVHTSRCNYMNITTILLGRQSLRAPAQATTTTTKQQERHNQRLKHVMQQNVCMLTPTQKKKKFTSVPAA
jgi:hypothetical protein